MYSMNKFSGRLIASSEAKLLLANTTIKFFSGAMRTYWPSNFTAAKASRLSRS